MSRSSRTLARVRAFALAPLAVVGLGFTAPADAAVTATYTNDFNDAGDAADFTESVPNFWFINNTNGTYRSENPSSGASRISSQLDVTNLGGPGGSAQDFEISATATPLTRADDLLSFGFYALATDPALISGTNYDLQFEYSPGDGFHQESTRLNLIEDSSSTAVTPTVLASDIFSVQMAAGESYDITLTGLYQDSGALELTASVADTLGNSAGFTVLDPTPRTGNTFGLNNTEGNSQFNVEFDDLSIVAVPEPASAALLALGGLALLGTRGRRRRGRAV